MRIPVFIMNRRLLDCQELRDQGFTYKQIAIELGLTHLQVIYVFNRDTQQKAIQTWRSKNKDYYKNQQQLFRDKWYGDCCIVCGSNHYLQYHHTEEGTKLFKISEGYTHPNKHNDTDIQSEIKKCVLLCAHCHRKLHFGTLDDYDYLWDGPLQQ